MPRPGVADVKIRFRLGERKLTLDYGKVPFSAWPQLKQATGFTQRTMVDAIINESDLEAIVALIWLERKQRERKLRYLDVYHELEASDSDEDFEIINLSIDGRLIGDTEDEDGESDDEDPTGGGTS